MSYQEDFRKSVEVGEVSLPIWLSNAMNAGDRHNTEMKEARKRGVGIEKERVEAFEKENESCSFWGPFFFFAWLFRH